MAVDYLSPAVSRLLMQQVEDITRFVYDLLQAKSGGSKFDACICQFTCTIDKDGMRSVFSTHDSVHSFQAVTSFDPSEAIKELARRRGWAIENKPAATKLLVEAAPSAPLEEPLCRPYREDEILF